MIDNSINILLVHVSENVLFILNDELEEFFDGRRLNINIAMVWDEAERKFPLYTAQQYLLNEGPFDFAFIYASECHPEWEELTRDVRSRKMKKDECESSLNTFCIAYHGGGGSYNSTNTLSICDYFISLSDIHFQTELEKIFDCIM